MRTTALITGIAGGLMAIAVGTIGLVVVATGLADLDQPVRAIALGLAGATNAVGLAALAGVVLASRGSAVAAPLLGLTAVAGFVTALPFSPTGPLAGPRDRLCGALSHHGFKRFV
jgi:hypothetical protein